MVTKLALNSFVLLFGIVFCSDEKMEREYVIVISGSDEFGSHSGRLFQDAINDMTKFIFGQLDAQTKRGIVFGHTDEDNKFTTLAPLATDTSAALEKLSQFMLAQPDVTLAPATGLSGCVTYCLREVFSKYYNKVKIVIMLLHEEVVATEIVRTFEMQKEERYQVMLFCVVFPWPGKACSTAKKTIRNIDKMHPNGVFCANEPEQFGNFPKIVDENMAQYKRLQAKVIRKQPEELLEEEEAEEEVEEDGESCLACWMALLACLIMLAAGGTIALAISNARQQTRAEALPEIKTEIRRASEAQIEFAATKPRKQHSLDSGTVSISTGKSSVSSGSSSKDGPERKRSGAGHHHRHNKRSSGSRLLAPAASILRKISSASEVSSEKIEVLRKPSHAPIDPTEKSLPKRAAGRRESRRMLRRSNTQMSMNVDEQERRISSPVVMQDKGNQLQTLL